MPASPHPRFSRPPVDRVALLVADERLADGIPAEELDLARRLVVAQACRIPRGAEAADMRSWCGDRGFALLVVDGVLTRELRLLERRSAEVFGPGDVIRAGAPAGDSLVAHAFGWTATETVTVAVLDDRFTMAARRWPSLGVALTARLLEQADRLALHVAIAQLGRVELRLLATLWHLADRWGRVTQDGVVVGLRLTHEALGRLVGAQRPTVTLALVELARTGAVTRSPERGGWLLDPAARPSLDGRPAAAVSGGGA